MYISSIVFMNHLNEDEIPNNHDARPPFSTPSPPLTPCGGGRRDAAYTPPPIHRYNLDSAGGGKVFFYQKQLVSKLLI